MGRSSQSAVQKARKETTPPNRKRRTRSSRLKTNRSRQKCTLPVDPPVSSNLANLYQKLPKGDYIRLLELAPGVPTDPVLIKLHVVELAQAQYSAISYVWGDNQDTAYIECQGVLLNIRVNLRQALVRIRHAHTPMTLWVDAVCINQFDLRERGHQVSLMGLIYRNAKTVFVCLGTDQDGDAYDVTTLLKDVGKLISKYPSVDFIPALKADDSLYSDPRWASMRTMLKHPWFYRVWTIQEVGLARDPRVLYGDVEFEYPDLMALGSWARVCAVHMYSWINLDLHITWSQNWRSIVMRRPENTFIDLLNHTRGLGCADERDHVYAFLGHPLARLNDGSGIIIAPDYEKHYLDVYLELAIRLVEHARVLRILSVVEHTEDSLSQTFPSWVPRWNVSQTLDTLGLTSRCYYEAAAGVRNNLHEVIKGSFLKVRGLIVGHISQSFQMSFMKAEDEDGVSDQEYKFRHKMAIQALWQDLSNQAASSAYSSEDCKDAFSLTMIAGLFGELPAEDENNLPSHQADFASWIQNSQDRSDSHNSEFQDRAGLGDGERFGYAMRLVCTGRNLILTEKGFYGLAPSITRPSDLCCVIYDTKVLYILRETDKPSHYKLVGEAYVHGFMRGEAIGLLGKGEFEEQDIILC